MDIESTLGERELEVFALIGEGLDTDAIAQRLAIRRKTIRAHRSAIMRKLHLESPIQLYQSSCKWLHERNGEAIHFEDPAQ